MKFSKMKSTKIKFTEMKLTLILGCAQYSTSEKFIYKKLHVSKSGCHTFLEFYIRLEAHKTGPKAHRYKERCAGCPVLEAHHKNGPEACHQNDGREAARCSS